MVTVEPPANNAGSDDEKCNMEEEEKFAGHIGDILITIIPRPE